MTKKPNLFKEEFATFLESPSRPGLRELIKNHHGEVAELDFKENWPERAKIVKTILGMANTGGGCVVFGMAETENSIEACGLSKLRDKADIDHDFRRFLPNVLMENLHVCDFPFTESEYPPLKGKSFQVVIVPDAPENLPFLPITETDGLRKTAIYVRRLASTEEASYDELQSLLSRKISSGVSTQPGNDLNHHLQQLESLYIALFRTRHHPLLSVSLHTAASHELFLKEMIQEKRSQIRAMLSID
jgi:predicted HTH transcriptional regulator